jgi:hypothetical protein
MLSIGDLPEFADMTSSVAPQSFDWTQASELVQSVGINSIKAFAVYKAWQTLPRGWVAPGLPVAIRPSSVPNAGDGLYASKFLPQGYTLGAYTGRLLENGEYQRKVQQYPKTIAYCWILSSGRVLDPTDEKGNLLDEVAWVAPVPNLMNEPFISKPTIFSYINEPQPGQDTNLVIEEGGFDGTEVRFITGKNIMKGEELFVDYGQNYDRSHYGRNDELLG